MNDSKITEMTERIKNEICKYDVDVLKTDNATKEEAIKASNELLSSLESIYA